MDEKDIKKFRLIVDNLRLGLKDIHQNIVLNDIPIKDLMLKDSVVRKITDCYCAMTDLSGYLH